MKNKIYVMIFILLLALPTQASPKYDIYIGNIYYNTLYPVITKEDTPYLSIYDLADLTKSSLSANTNSNYTLTYEGTTFEVKPNTPFTTSGTSSYGYHYPSFIENDILYVPYTFLDTIEHPYKLSNNKLYVDTIIPYSRNSDNYNNHLFIESSNNLLALPDYLPLLSSTEFIANTLTNSIHSGEYIAFLDSQHRLPFYSQVKEKISYSPYNNVEVLFRPIYTSSSNISTSHYEAVTVRIDPKKDQLVLWIQDQPISTSKIWSTFMPRYSYTKVDIDKSIDMTIIRMLYTLYRDHFHLRDDQSFSPLLTLSPDRTTTYKQEVYNDKGYYEIIISRVHTTGKLTFFIDIIGL